MEVPTIEQFRELQKTVHELQTMMEHMQRKQVHVEWVSYETAQILLNCSRMTIYRLVKRNELAVENRGRSVRFSMASIRAYLLSKRYTPESVELRINSLLVA